MSNTKNSATKKSRITFELVADVGANVFLAGSFNDWTPQKPLIDKEGDGLYRCAMMLPPGIYEYKFKVNDSWQIDAKNPNFTQNALGTLNSVITVP